MNRICRQRQCTSKGHNQDGESHYVPWHSRRSQALAQPLRLDLCPIHELQQLDSSQTQQARLAHALGPLPSFITEKKQVP
jgi:hypothetical protein